MRLVLNGEWRSVTDVDANLTLLEWLRGEAGLTGTKEGCASGDCGACSVLVAEPGKPWRAINACLTPLGNVAGRQVCTVEALAQNGQPHPVQQAMVECHGSQCGFCTPGFVSALAALYHNSQAKGVQTLDREAVLDAISGNLCRCTGYRPIVEAGTKMQHFAPAGLPMVQNAMPAESAVATAPLLSDGTHHFFQPSSEAELQHLLREYPQAVLVSGATDLGLELTQRHKQFPVLISLTAIASLKEFAWQQNALHIGAALPYTDLEHAMATQSRPFMQLMHRFASRQIRHQGTVGGNIANGSPIADMPPVLLAWDAEVEVVDASGERCWHPLSTFYLGYRKTLLRTGQYLARVRIPRAALQRPHRFFKLSKRVEDDISTVMLAVSLVLEDGQVGDVRIALGGVAATPVRAAATEAVLQGQLLSNDVLKEAMQALQSELHPISDVRASADYRRKMAANLLQRALLELWQGLDIEIHHLPTSRSAALYV